MERLTGWQDVKQQANIIVGHSCIHTISHNQRKFLYLHYFVQPKDVLVSILFRTAKGHSCISTISYNPRAFLYLYYFVQLHGILEWLPFLTTKGFHIFVFMFFTL